LPTGAFYYALTLSPRTVFNSLANFLYAVVWHQATLRGLRGELCSALCLPEQPKDSVISSALPVYLLEAFPLTTSSSSKSFFPVILCLFLLFFLWISAQLHPPPVK